MFEQNMFPLWKCEKLQCLHYLSIMPGSMILYAVLQNMHKLFVFALNYSAHDTTLKLEGLFVPT